MWVAAGQQSGKAKLRVEVVGGGACTWGAEVECEVPKRLLIASVLSILGMIVYGLMIFVYIFRAFRQYKKELYQRYRLTNMLVRMQARTNLPRC